MAVHVIKKDQTAEFDITKGNESWLLAKGTTVETTDSYGIFIDYDADNTKLTVAGTVDVLDDGGDAIYVGADNASIRILGSGLVRSAGDGVSLEGDGASLTNHGRILITKSGEAGVFANGKANTIENDGLIKSLDNTVCISAAANSPWRTTGRLQAIMVYSAIRGRITP